MNALDAFLASSAIALAAGLLLFTSAQLAKRNKLRKQRIRAR